MFSGKSIARLEDARFLTGRGRYVSDMVPADALHAVVLRSPHAHAVLGHINADAARAMSGVEGIYTAALHGGGSERCAHGGAAAPCFGD
jgi:carbon-monoxide dehydrogenase large subunit